MRLVLEQALEPELVRVQALRVQALVRVQLEPLARVQALMRVQLEPLVQAQQELKRHLQRNRPKLQPHRHRCKVPDRSREPQ